MSDFFFYSLLLPILTKDSDGVLHKINDCFVNGFRVSRRIKLKYLLELYAVRLCTSADPFYGRQCLQGYGRLGSARRLLIPNRFFSGEQQCRRSGPAHPGYDSGFPHCTPVAQWWQNRIQIRRDGSLLWLIQFHQIPPPHAMSGFRVKPSRRRIIPRWRR